MDSSQHDVFAKRDPLTLRWSEITHTGKNRRVCFVFSYQNRDTMRVALSGWLRKSWKHEVVCLVMILSIDDTTHPMKCGQNVVYVRWKGYVSQTLDHSMATFSSSSGGDTAELDRQMPAALRKLPSWLSYCSGLPFPTFIRLSHRIEMRWLVLQRRDMVSHRSRGPYYS